MNFYDRDPWEPGRRRLNYWKRHRERRRWNPLTSTLATMAWTVLAVLLAWEVGTWLVRLLR
jgi:hypothetical protein